MKKKMAKSIIRLLFVFLVASACLFGFFSVENQEVSKVQTFDKAYLVADLDSLFPAKEEVQVVEEAPETIEEEKVVSSPVVFQPQPVVNPFEGCEGTISVAGFERCLMKDENGDHYYLNHNLKGVEDGVGVPYIDFRHDFTDHKTIIYSHSSMQGNGQFQGLQNYHNNPGFYSNHRYITVNYQGEVHTYEILSVYVSVADSEESEGLEYFHKNYYTQTDWENTIQKYRNNSEYDTGVSVDGNDKILILQTCSMDPNYYQKYYRYNLLIMGKLV